MPEISAPKSMADPLKGFSRGVTSKPREPIVDDLQDSNMDECKQRLMMVRDAREGGVGKDDAFILERRIGTKRLGTRQEKQDGSMRSAKLQLMPSYRSTGRVHACNAHDVRAGGFPHWSAYIRTRTQPYARSHINWWAIKLVRVTHHADTVVWKGYISITHSFYRLLIMAAAHFAEPVC